MVDPYGSCPFQAGETVTSNNCTTRCTCHPSQGLVCEDTQCPQDHVCSTRDGAQLCVKQQGQCHLNPGASLTTFDGTKGMLLTSGTYKVAALCNEQSPNWFKVVLEVNECREDRVPAAVAIFIFFREAFITVNANMEVWVRTWTRLEDHQKESLKGVEWGYLLPLRCPTPVSSPSSLLLAAGQWSFHPSPNQRLQSHLLEHRGWERHRLPCIRHGCALQPQRRRDAHRWGHHGQPPLRSLWQLQRGPQGRPEAS